ncbi:hypothetical protein HELRODRAFT_183039 [Helobdella robusta]|uniref:Uncharacterized protein n=1 Tax=Helobdella robusta TaxID=6412 RepID=T1FJ35_HELRO|nr:hypothetical protein HELRODRAFT_183039 [Helobdella robusta]ESN89920.1 hypothetical protein HELRODRAFT_183039 [Helobdella robusta]
MASEIYDDEVGNDGRMDRFGSRKKSTMHFCQPTISSCLKHKSLLKSTTNYFKLNLAATAVATSAAAANKKLRHNNSCSSGSSRRLHLNNNACTAATTFRSNYKTSFDMQKLSAAVISIEKGKDSNEEFDTKKLLSLDSMQTSLVQTQSDEATKQKTTSELQTEPNQNTKELLAPTFLQDESSRVQMQAEETIRPTTAVPPAAASHSSKIPVFKCVRFNTPDERDGIESEKMMMKMSDSESGVPSGVLKTDFEIEKIEIEDKTFPTKTFAGEASCFVGGEKLEEEVIEKSGELMAENDVSNSDVNADGTIDETERFNKTKSGVNSKQSDLKKCDKVSKNQKIFKNKSITKNFIGLKGMKKNYVDGIKWEKNTKNRQQQQQQQQQQHHHHEEPQQNVPKNFADIIINDKINDLYKKYEQLRFSTNDIRKEINKRHKESQNDVISLKGVVLEELTTILKTRNEFFASIKGVLEKLKANQLDQQLRIRNLVAECEQFLKIFPTAVLFVIMKHLRCGHDFQSPLNERMNIFRELIEKTQNYSPTCGVDDDDYNSNNSNYYDIINNNNNNYDTIINNNYNYDTINNNNNYDTINNNNNYDTINNNNNYYDIVNNNNNYDTINNNNYNYDTINNNNN